MSSVQALQHQVESIVGECKPLRAILHSRRILKKKPKRLYLGRGILRDRKNPGVILPHPE